MPPPLLPRDGLLFALYVRGEDDLDTRPRCERLPDCGDCEGCTCECHAFAADAVEPPHGTSIPADVLARYAR